MMECLQKFGLNIDELKNIAAQSKTYTLKTPIGGTYDNIQWKEVQFSIDPHNWTGELLPAKDIALQCQSAISIILKAIITVAFVFAVGQLLWEL
mgnify:CR=1 FL=1